MSHMVQQLPPFIYRSCNGCYSVSPAQDKMLLKLRTNSPKVYVVVAVLLVFLLTQTEASTLKENADQNGGKKATEVTNDYKPGVIEFGKGPKRSEDDLAYQADDPGWFTKRQEFDMLSPSVLCGPNDMKFSMFGRPSKHLTMPQMPLSCGYNMRRNPFGLVLRVPYDGCNVEIADGSFNLPLIWNGFPVTAKCPKSEDPTILPPVPHPLFPWLLWPLPQETTTATPPVFQFPPGLHHHHYPWPLPQNPFFPQYPGFFQSYFHKHPPIQSTPPSPQDSLSNYWWWYQNNPMYKLPPYQSPNAHTLSQSYSQYLKLPFDHKHLYGKPGMQTPASRPW